MICVRDRHGQVTPPRSGVTKTIYSSAAVIDTAVLHMGVPRWC
jgi:hypothetical protein